jgi:hypothetical protein
MTQAMFHISLVNSVGKIAHPHKQFFSTGMTEFLKKTYDLFDNKMYYSPCRMISSILFEKENRKSKANNKNNMKDIVDVWNLFLIRIPDESRRKFIREKLYAQNCVRTKFKFYTEPLKLTKEDMNKLFSTPSNVNGFLMGPLTKPEKLFQKSEKYKNLGFDLHKIYFNAVMNDYDLSSEAVCKQKNWVGINSYISQIMRRVQSSNSVLVANPTLRNKMRTNLTNTIFENVSEPLREYKQPKDLGTILPTEENEFSLRS